MPEKVGQSQPTSIFGDLQIYFYIQGLQLFHINEEISLSSCLNVSGKKIGIIWNTYKNQGRTAILIMLMQPDNE